MGFPRGSRYTGVMSKQTDNARTEAEAGFLEEVLRAGSEA